MADVAAPPRSEAIATASSHHSIDDGPSLPTCFARIVAARGARPAVASGDWQPSYAELDVAANRIANTLIERGAAPGDRVAILMEHNGAQIAAALAVLKAGCIGVALNPSQPPAATGAIIDHAGAGLVIVDPARRELAAAAAPKTTFVDYEAALAEGAARDPGLAIPAAQTAFLVYTSGSTGTPKAIMRTHALLRQNAMRHGRGVDIAADDRLTLLASLSGGQGIGVVWTALLSGAALCPYPVADRGFAALADRLEADRVTTFISSASVFRGFAKTLSPDRQFPLVRAVRIASEMATAEDFDAFRRHFPPSARFVHSYGCSEVGNVTQHVVAPGERVTAGRLPVGRPADDITLAIVDETGRSLPAGQTGTIVITGRYLAAGYWREPAQTAERFTTVPGAPGMRSFRSGDLGRFDEAGRLSIVGRSDSQVKIHGQRVELTAVEAAIRQVPGIEQAAACAVPQADGDARLVAYVVISADAAATIGRLRRSLRAALPRAMVPTAFVTVGALPLTPHGKVDRAALVARHSAPAPPSAGGAPQDAIERRIAAMWAEALELSTVGRDDDFFALGGDSLTAAIVAMRVHDALAVEIELAAFAAHPTVTRFAAEIARRIDGQDAASEPPLRRIPRDGALPLSLTQQRLWSYSRAPTTFAAYRHVRRSRLIGPLDRSALGAAIDAVVRRHEILRTCFPAVDGVPRAEIAAPAPTDLSFLDAAGVERPLDRAEAFATETAREIAELARLPLLRFALVRIAADDHIFYRINHHIIGDGESWRIFFDELEAAYRSIRLDVAPRPRMDDVPEYVDYADWQSQRLRPDRPAVQSALAWWKETLRETWPDFAPRFRRAVPQSGLDPMLGHAHVELDAGPSAAIDALARANGTTPFVAGLAAVASVLADECASDRIVVGTYLSLRNRAALERMLGDFTAPVLVPLSLVRDFTFRDWLRRVHAQVAAATSHAAVPDDLVRRRLASDGHALPRLGVTFNRYTEPTVRAFDTLELRGLPNPAEAMPWGLSIVVAPADGSRLPATLTARFDAGLYEPAQVAAVLDRLVRFLAAAVRTPDERLGKLQAQSIPPRPPGALRRYATRLMSFGGSMSRGSGQT